jgi:hypothetical protein
MPGPIIDGPDQLTPSLLVQLSTAALPSLCVKLPTSNHAPAVFRVMLSPLAGVHAADGGTGVDHPACAGVAAAVTTPTAIETADRETTLLVTRYMRPPLG